MSALCTRRGCGHTKQQHDDPLMEGMCAVNGCNCLGFVGVGVRARALPVQTAVQTSAPPAAEVEAGGVVRAPAAPPAPVCWCGETHPEGEWHDPTHGTIDRDIQDRVAEMNPTSRGQRVAMENTIQTRRDREKAWERAEEEPFPQVTIAPGYELAHEKHSDGQKRCPHCSELKPVEGFSPVKTNYDGLHGWCRACMNARPFAPTLARALRNRARHRASADLIQRYLDEFNLLYAQYHEEVQAEARELAEAEEAKGLYGDGPGEYVRLKPGRRNKGEKAVDRIDVARCPECIRSHDAGHVCIVCGSLPEHREVTRTAWQSVQDRLRDKPPASESA